MIIGLIFGVYVLGWCVFRAALSYKYGCAYREWVRNYPHPSTTHHRMWDDRRMAWPWVWPLVIAIAPVAWVFERFSALFDYFENLGRENGC